MYIVPWICVLQDGTLIGWEVLLTILWEFPLLAWATGKMQKNLGNLGKHFTKPLIQVTARPSMTLRSSLLNILRFIRLRFFRKLDSHSRKTRWRDEMAVQMRGADDSRVQGDQSRCYLCFVDIQNSKQRLHFSVCSLYWNTTSVLVSTTPRERDGSPCN